MKTALRVVLFSVILIGLVAGLCLSQRAATPFDPNQTPVTPGELIIQGKDGKAAGACPLKHTDVNAEISGFLARVNVVQEFTNPTANKIEAVYTFPLAEDSAVDHMEMQVGKRTIVGEIHRSEEAMEIYETAKEAGHVASLLDQQRPNIFTQSVANIMPGEKVKITISYTQVLKYEAGVYDFSFPMVVGPRFIPGEATGASGTGTAADTTAHPELVEGPGASKITPPVAPKDTRAGHDISIKVRIDAGIPMNWVNCPSHQVNCEYPSHESAVITLKDQATIPNKDFLVKYEVAGDQVQSGLITSAPGGLGGFFTLIMQPPKTVNPAMVTPKEMIFVIDRSGSQQGEPIAKSRDTMLHCIRNVNPGDTFNMISFADDMTTLFDEPKPFNQETEAAAVKFLDEIKADGGTVAMPAIKAALERPADPKRLRIVVFFTDGMLGNDFEAIDAVQKSIGDARIFAFGIGSSTNRFLIEKMAEEGRGASEIVMLNADSKIVAERFYNRIRNPILTDISVDWGGLPVSADEVYPKRAPDLFSAQPLVLKGTYDAAASGKITIHGKLNGAPWSETIDADLPKSQTDNDGLASIWARAKVDDLMSKDWLGAQTGNPDPNVKDDIIKVALQYNLMTQYTSFVAVETMVVTQGGKPVTVAVPVEMPEGMSYEALADKGGIAIANSNRFANFYSLSRSESVSAGYGGMAGTGVAAGKHSVAARGHVAKPSAPATVAPAPNPAGGTSTAATSGSAPTVAALVDEKLMVESELSMTMGVAKQLTAAEQRQQTIDRKLDRSLGELAKSYAAWKAVPKSAKKYAVPAGVVVKNGKVQVMIWLKAGGSAKLAELVKLGLADKAWVLTDKALIGWLPVAKLGDAAVLEFVSRLSTPDYVKAK